MRTWFVYLLLLLLPCAAIGQENSDLRQRYLQAEAEYGIGHFDASIGLLEEQIGNFRGTLKESAYRLLALCYLNKDNMPEAERYISLLLKEDPYYNVTIHDPLRFADIVERFKKGGNATITTASQQAESIDEAPVPVTVITEQMIQDSGAKTLAELLTLYVPGMSLISGSELNVALHGVYSSSQEKILILLDGHRLNSRATNSEAPDFRTSLKKVQQIEVLRGPASSLYGNVALTAVVNIITKKGFQVDGAQVSLAGGNNQTYRADFLLGKGSFDFDFMGWASVYFSRGEERYLDADDEGFYGKVLRPGSMYIGGYNHKPAYDIGFTARWKDINVLFNTQYAKKIPSYVTVRYPSLYDYDRYRIINGSKPGHARQATHGEVNYEKSGEKWSGKVSAFIDIESCSYYDVAADTLLAGDRYLPVGPGEVLDSTIKVGMGENGVYQVQAWNDYVYGGSAQAIYHFQTEKWKGNLLFGTQIENYTMKDNTMIIGDHYDRIIITYSDANRSLLLGNELNASVFTQLKASLGKKLIFNGGLRYDYKHRYNGKKLNEFSPRLSFIYYINSNSHLKLGYSHSFVDAPFFYRATTIATYSGGNKLEAEQMNAVQFSFDQSFKEKGLKYEVNFYYNALEDIVCYGVPNDAGDLLSNAGSLKVCGLEGTVSYEKAKWYTMMNFSYQHLINSTNYTVTGSHINAVPDFLMNCLCAYQVLKRKEHELKVRGNLSFQTKQYAPLVSNQIYLGDQIVYDPEYQLGARAIVNAGLDYHYKRATASVSIYNLFDTDYYQGGSTLVPQPQQGRNFMFTLSYLF